MIKLKTITDSLNKRNGFCALGNLVHKLIIRQLYYFESNTDKQKSNKNVTLIIRRYRYEKVF